MTRKQKFAAIQNKIQFIAMLYARWLDEKDYEDINEYGKVLSQELGFDLTMTKRPFGFKFDGDLQFKIYANGTWKVVRA